MAWSEECESEINRLLSTQDVSEVVAVAVNGLVQAGLDAIMLNMHGSCPSGCDPSATKDFNERLLCACIDEIRGKR